MPKPAKVFNASDYTATKFSTAEDKAAFGNSLIHFIASGFVKTLFTEKLYNRLSMTFQMIAHYDRHQYWEEYFVDTESQLRFLRQLAQSPCYGSPEFTFSDLESDVKQYILRNGFVPMYEAKLRREKESAERATLAVLQARYGASDTVSMAPEPPATPYHPDIPVNAASAFAHAALPSSSPIQGSLFG